MKSINQIIKSGNRIRALMVSILEKYKEIIDNPYILENSNLIVYNNMVLIHAHNSIVYFEINQYKLTLTNAFVNINPNIEKVLVVIKKENALAQKKQEERKSLSIYAKRQRQHIQNEIEKNIDSLEDENIKKYLRNIMEIYLNSDEAYMPKCKKCNSPRNSLKDGICFHCMYEKKEEEFKKACSIILKDNMYKDNTKIFKEAREYLADEIFSQILNMEEIKNKKFEDTKVIQKIIRYIRIKGATNDMDVINSSIKNTILRIKRIVDGK